MAKMQDYRIMVVPMDHEYDIAIVSGREPLIDQVITSNFAVESIQFLIYAALDVISDVIGVCEKERHDG